LNQISKKLELVSTVSQPSFGISANKWSFLPLASLSKIVLFTKSSGFSLPFGPSFRSRLILVIIISSLDKSIIELGAVPDNHLR